MPLITSTRLNSTHVQPYLQPLQEPVLPRPSSHRLPPRSVAQKATSRSAPSVKPVSVAATSFSRKPAFIAPVIKAKQTQRFFSTGPDLSAPNSPAADAEVIAEAKKGLPPSEGPYPTSQAVDIPSLRVKKILDELSQLTMLEAAQLAKAMAKHFGIPEGGMPMMGAPMMAAPAAAAPAAAAPAAPAGGDKKKEEAAPRPAQTKFDVKLISYPEANKFKLLKEIRVLKPGMALMDSKALLEGLPKIIAKDLGTKDAETWKTKLAEAGAAVIELV